MSTPSGPVVPEGWYADPTRQAAWRWWDGTRWTDHSSTPAGPPPTSVLGTFDAYRSYNAAELNTPFDPLVHPVFAGEQKIATWSARAFYLYVVIALVGIVEFWVGGAWMRNFLHTIFEQSQSGIIDTSVGPPAAYTIISQCSIVPIAVYWVTVCLWQYRSARTAQLLRLPATYTPGFGVFSWFIPVVNLWFPYQAVRDLLPPGDPQRSLVLQWWLAWVGTGTASLITFLLAFADSPAAIVLSIITVVLAIAFGVLGARVVDVVRTTHLRLIVGPQGDL